MSKDDAIRSALRPWVRTGGELDRATDAIMALVEPAVTDLTDLREELEQAEWLSDEVSQPVKNEYPNPQEPGTALFRVWRRTAPKLHSWSGDWDDLIVETGEGGGFYSVQETIGLDYYLAQIGFAGHGWYVIEGITEHFFKDYWGEVDAETNHTQIRRATLPERILKTPNATWLDVFRRPLPSTSASLKATEKSMTGHQQVR